jgi:hypothetical protein
MVDKTVVDALANTVDGSGMYVQGYMAGLAKAKKTKQMFVAILAEATINALSGGVDILECYGPFSSVAEAAKETLNILYEDGETEFEWLIRNPGPQATLDVLEECGWHFVEVELVETLASMLSELP